MVTRTGGAGSGIIISFLSYGGGAGQTAAVANIAWILAAAGQKVLVVDSRAEAPALHRYFAPFGRPLVIRDRPADRGDPLSATVRLDCDPPSPEGRVDYLGPALPEPAPGIRGESPRFDWAVWSRRLPELRRRLMAAGYDYVLVDGPAGGGDAAVATAAQLSDSVVLCLSMTPGVILGSGALARRMLSRRFEVRILPVPMGVDDRDPQGLRRARLLARERFAAITTGGPAVLGQIEVPYLPEFSHDEKLAVLVGGSQAAPLVRAYELMTRAITDDRVRTANSPSDVLRERYIRALDHAFPTLPRAVSIVYAPRDRVWADWCRGLLGEHGVPTEMVSVMPARTLPAVEGGRHLLLISPGRLIGLNRTHVDEPPGAQPGGGAQVSRTFAVLIDDTEPPEWAASIDRIDLREVKEEQAEELLRKRLGLTPFQEFGPSQGTRFPGGVRRGGTAEVGAARLPFPPRYAGFVGRDGFLEEMRDNLAPTTLAQGPYYLRGAEGVGKSQLVLEYVYRFASDYDIIWWIPGGSRNDIRKGLADLAVTLQIPSRGDGAKAMLKALDVEPARWLLVYDNVGDIAHLDGLLPSSRAGHVIVTLTSTDPESPGEQVPPFEREESVALLRRVVPALDPAGAATVARAVHDVPLAVELAGAWIGEDARWRRYRNIGEGEAAALAVTRFREELAREDGASSRDDSSDIRAIVRMALNVLKFRRLSAGVIWMLQLITFLNPAHISLRLLRSWPVLDELARFGEGLDDPLMIDAVLAKAECYGLIEVRWGKDPAVHTNALIQRLIREEMTEEETRVRQAQALRVLAAHAYPRFDPTDDAHKAVFEELWNHLRPSGALTSTDTRVCDWILNQLRYLYNTSRGSRLEAGREIGAEAMAVWTRHAETRELVPDLQVLMANLQRALNRWDEAHALDLGALETLRSRHGLRSARTLAANRGYAADLRALGRFDMAAAEELSILLVSRYLFGDDHEQTLAAANNCALSAYLAGNVHEALDLEQQTYARRVRLWGADSYWARWSGCNVGVYLRELGRYEDAEEWLRSVRENVGGIGGATLDVARLRLDRSLAATYRRLGRKLGDPAKLDQARTLHSATLEGHRALFGADYSSTLACTAGYAWTLHAVGAHTAAVEYGTLAYEGLSRTANPFAMVAAANLAVFRRAVGDKAAARDLGGEALEHLAERLGDLHPYTLAATVNHAGTLAVLGDHTGALRLDRGAWEGYVARFGRDSPYAAIAMANYADSRRLSLGEPGAGRHVRSDIDIEVLWF
ncbi:FxSxx-COOH system tetratricopeptide repeat protein [Sinosporangium siamense]|uniref:NTPase n=1 Tax=Sinosporangium siamense TaxID=1367973 RepID=A0A919VBD9_9ACTN|nr:FxSxx-COOH system tetratricopeptide repeat protein [Sinosporangium siamense]GII92014.1 NTPase [Sinosporangium siamense]